MIIMCFIILVIVMMFLHSIFIMHRVHVIKNNYSDIKESMIINVKPMNMNIPIKLQLDRASIRKLIVELEEFENNKLMIESEKFENSSEIRL